MKVLIAEDDRLFQRMLSGALSKWGYQVVVVSDGEEALRQIQADDGPQFAILDWVMPKMDGLEVCRRVRIANLPHYVYIILLTAKQGSDLVDGFEAGVDDYLFKPVNLDELRMRLRAGLRVWEAGQWYQSIAETASDGVVILRDHNVVFANTAAGAIFGFEKRDLLGQAFWSLLSGSDVTQHDLAAFGRGQLPNRFEGPAEVSVRTRCGRDVVLEISLSQFASLDQNHHLTALIRDITVRKAREKGRAQAYKMESIGQLAAGVAHEINTPIQYIGDNIGFLQESYLKIESLLDAYQELLFEVKATGSCAERVGQIEDLMEQVNLPFLAHELPLCIEQSYEGVEQVASIVAAMKDFSHPGSAGMTPTDLNHVIEGAVLISRNEWKYVADIRTNLGAGIPLTPCSPGELRQVMLNLIVNAADAVADAIKQKPQSKGLIEISSRFDGDAVEIRVSDSGVGIPEFARAKVFDLFYTTKEVGKGSGQGLALAYSSIVKRHSGSIEIESEVGVGTTFIVRLPSTQPDRTEMEWNNRASKLAVGV